MATTELTQAVKDGDAERAKTLIEEASLDILTQPDQDGIPMALLVATSSSNAAAAKADLLLTLAKKGLNVATKNVEGTSALDALVSSCTPEEGAAVVLEGVIRPLVLEGKEDVLTQLALEGWRHFCVTSGKEGETDLPEDAKQVVAKLIELREKIWRLEEAICEGKLGDVKELMEEVALRSSKGVLGLPPLHQAVVNRDPDIVRHIVTQFPDLINGTDQINRTALHYAAGSHDAGYIYSILQDAGADVTCQDMAGKTPQDYVTDPHDVSATTIQQRIRAELHGQTALTGEEDLADQEMDIQVGQEPSGENAGQNEADSQQEEKPATPKPATPPGPKVHKPMDMYVRGPGVNQQMAPPPSTKEGRYIAQQLGTALTLALAEIAEKRPWDPIEYLAKWLYKYHKNEAYVTKQADMLKTIREEETKLNHEEELKFKRKEELLRLQEDEARKRKEEEEERRRKELEEMQRSNKETILAQKPQLPTVTEDEEAEVEGEPDDDPNVKDRNVDGLTEMHKLASQNGMDLSSLLDLGYSIADRDVKGRTVKDIANEAGQTETVEAIDKYVKRLLQDGIVETLETLTVEGYDFTNLVEGELPEVTKNFLQKVTTIQEQVSSAHKAIASGHLEELTQSLDALPRLDQSKDDKGRSLLHLAVLADAPTCVQMLVSKSPALLDSRDNVNRTALHYAYGVSDDLVALLLSKGARPNARDVYKRNPGYYKGHKAEITGYTSPPGVSIPTVSVTPEPDETAKTGEASTVEEKEGKADDSQLEEDTAQAPQLATTSVTETPDA